MSSGGVIQWLESHSLSTHSDEAADEEEEVEKKGSSGRPHGYPMVKGEVDYRVSPENVHGCLIHRLTCYVV